jgi:hypothetical protein
MHELLVLSHAFVWLDATMARGLKLNSAWLGRLAYSVSSTSADDYKNISPAIYVEQISFLILLLVISPQTDYSHLQILIFNLRSSNRSFIHINMTTMTVIGGYKQVQKRLIVCCDGMFSPIQRLQKSIPN